MLNVKPNIKGLTMMDTAQARGGDIHFENKVNKRIGQICSVGLLVTTVALLSCRSNLKDKSRVVDTKIICTVLEPIEWRDADTEKTRADINAYNTVWNYYCDRDKYLKNKEQLEEIS